MVVSWIILGEGRSGKEDVEGKDTNFEVDVGGWGRPMGVGCWGGEGELLGIFKFKTDAT